jgi:hypothetical protein
MDCCPDTHNSLRGWVFFRRNSPLIVCGDRRVLLLLNCRGFRVLGFRDTCGFVTPFYISGSASSSPGSFLDRKKTAMWGIFNSIFGVRIHEDICYRTTCWGQIFSTFGCGFSVAYWLNDSLSRGYFLVKWVCRIVPDVFVPSFGVCKLHSPKSRPETDHLGFGFGFGFPWGSPLPVSDAQLTPLLSSFQEEQFLISLGDQRTFS